MNMIATKSRTLSAKDFLGFGLDHLVYIKDAVVNNERVYAIHAADGTPLTVMNERDTAFATARQNDMEPVSVH